MKTNVAMVLMCLSFGASAQSEDILSTLDQDYKKINELRVQLYLAARKEFGENIRTAAVLEACGKKDLAAVVMPSDEQLLRFFSQKVVQAGEQSSPAAEVLNRRGGEMGLHLVNLSYFQLVQYKFGYQEAVKTLKVHVPSVCIAAEELAKKQRTKSQ